MSCALLTIFFLHVLYETVKKHWVGLDTFNFQAKAQCFALYFSFYFLFLRDDLNSVCSSILFPALRPINSEADVDVSSNGTVGL